MRLFRLLFAFVFVLSASAEDGYRLWLRYDPIANDALRELAISAAQRWLAARG